LGFWPTPDTTGEYVDVYYYRTAPIYGLQFNDMNTDTTDVKVQNSGKALTLTITGGTYAGSYPYPFTNDATIGQIVDRINLATHNVKATLGEHCNYDRQCTDLELITSADFHGTEWALFFPIEVPEEFQRSVMIPKMLAVAQAKAGNFDKSIAYNQASENGIQAGIATYLDRQKSLGIETIKDVYSGSCDDWDGSPSMAGKGIIIE